MLYIKEKCQRGKCMNEVTSELPHFIKHQNHQSFSPFLVHYSVSTFSASDWIPGLYFIFDVPLSKNNTSRAAALVVGHLSGCPLLVPLQREEVSLLCLINFLS